ncbi:MAG: ice-binding family protein [Thermoplasmata archaeon]
MKRNLTATLVAIAVLVIVLSMASAGLSQGAASPHEQATPAATVQGAVIGGTNGPTPYISPSTCGQAKIYLGDAGHFVVLAGTTVTNTLMTVVHGNLGLSPGSAVTGFPPGKVTGATDIANKAAANAQLALVKAYNTGMGRTNCAVSVSGNIGGRTLGPGLYHSSSSLAISSGDLTLTAHGHSGAVFVIQVTSKLTVTSGRHVILAGGAQASNIYWIVGSSATLGTTAVVYGNILAHKSISLATGATLHGRALAHIGAVTLEGNKIAAVAISPGALLVTGSVLTPAPFIARLIP